MLCRAQTSLTDVPSASRRTPIICSSLNRLFFMVLLLSSSQQNSSCVTSTLWESGQLDACVIAFASHFVSDDGSIWRLIARMNRLSSGEQAILTGLGIFSVTSRKTVELRDLDVRLK